MSEINIGFINELQDKVSEILPKDRFNHTLGVAYLASSLAMCYEIDDKLSLVAGLLHDIAKHVPYEEAITLCKENNLGITEIEVRNPFLIHGKLGAFYAKTIYGINNDEILSAIEFHTTGKPGMTMLEKIIFLADYIEVHRLQQTNPSLSKIRPIAFKNIDMAVYYVLENTLSYLSNKKQEIDHLTVETYEYYKKELKQ